MSFKQVSNELSKFGDDSQFFTWCYSVLPYICDLTIMTISKKTYLWKKKILILFENNRYITPYIRKTALF